MANYTTNKPPHVVQPGNTNAGQVTGPGAGTTIVALASLPKGTYLVALETVYTGTLTAAETIGNMKLQTDMGAVGAFVDAAILGTPPAVGFTLPTQWFLVDTAGVAGIKIIAIGAAGAAAVYGAHIVAYPLHTST